MGILLKNPPLPEWLQWIVTIHFVSSFSSIECFERMLPRRGGLAQVRGTPAQIFCRLTRDDLETIFGLKHHWGKAVIFYINEVCATPGTGGAGRGPLGEIGVLL